MFELIAAANYLDIADLMDAACNIVAEMMRNKTAEEIRLTFNIENDFTPEQQSQIDQENAVAGPSRTV